MAQPMGSPIPPPKPAPVMNPHTPAGNPKITIDGIKSVVGTFFKDLKESKDSAKLNKENAKKDLLERLDAYASSLGPEKRAGPEMSELPPTPHTRPDAHPGEVAESDGKPIPPERTNKHEKLITGIREQEKRELTKERDDLKKEKEINMKQIEVLKKEIDEWKYNVSQYEHKLSQYEHDRAKFEQHMMALDEQLKTKRNENKELYIKNEELRKEASQYQSALGDAKNYRLGDNDANNPTQLTKDIEMIQDKINEFCKLKGGKGGVEINEQPLALLLEHYNCKQLEPGDKVLPKAALQRLIIETILRKTNDYLQTQQKDINDYKMVQDNDKVEEKYLELKVLNSTNEYLSIVDNLIHSRKGTDEVSFAAPKKIRQLVNAVLGDRGFGGSDKGEHEFILDIKNEIISMMNNYRTIKKPEKKQENEDMIADIIRNVIKIFVFRIKVLEPPGEIEWIANGSKIDPTLMEIGNLEDDNYDDWVVNLCSFPLIFVKSETDRKVLVLAKMFPIKAEPRQRGGGVNSLKNLVFGERPQQQSEGNEQRQQHHNKKNSIDESRHRNSTDPRIQ